MHESGFWPTYVGFWPTFENESGPNKFVKCSEKWVKMGLLGAFWGVLVCFGYCLKVLAHLPTFILILVKEK